jgi:hypothetical protein
MSSGASSSSSPPPAEAGDGYWAAREEAASRLEAMAAREDELSAEQLETNNQLQEDEVMYLVPPISYRAPSCLWLASLSASPARAGNRWIISGAAEINL